MPTEILCFRGKGKGELYCEHLSELPVSHLDRRIKSTYTALPMCLFWAPKVQSSTIHNSLMKKVLILSLLHRETKAWE